MAPIGARCTHVHTSHLIDRQVVSDKSADVAGGVIDARPCCLHDNERYLRQSGATWNPLGISGCVLRTHGCETFLQQAGSNPLGRIVGYSSK